MAVLDIFLRTATLVVAGFAVYVAFQGLQTWRRQLYGQAEFDLARRLALAVARLHNHVRLIRNEFRSYMLTGDTLNALGQNIFEFEAVSLEAEVMWGQPVVAARIELVRCVNKLLVNLHRYDLTKEQKTPAPIAVAERADGIIFGNDEDELGREFANAVERVRELIRPHLPRPRHAR